MLTLEALKTCEALLDGSADSAEDETIADHLKSGAEYLRKEIERREARKSKGKSST